MFRACAQDSLKANKPTCAVCHRIVQPPPASCRGAVELPCVRCNGGFEQQRQRARGCKSEGASNLRKAAHKLICVSSCQTQTEFRSGTRNDSVRFQCDDWSPPRFPTPQTTGFLRDDEIPPRSRLFRPYACYALFTSALAMATAAPPAAAPGTSARPLPTATLWSA